MSYNPLDANIPDPVQSKSPAQWAGGITMLVVVVVSGIAWFMMAWKVLLDFELVPILVFAAVSVPFMMGMDRIFNAK